MVLDDASPQEGFVDDTPSTNDFDSYGVNVNPNFPLLRRYNIDINKLPQPVLLPGNNTAKFNALSRTFNDVLNHRMREVQRPLTQSEAEAVMYLEAKNLRTSTLGMPIFSLVGLARCYQTASTFRFPMYQPKPDKFNPNSALFGTLKGVAARGLWHALRMSMYMGSIGFLGTFFLMAPYAANVRTAGYMTDPRLKQYNEDLKAVRRVKMDELMKNSGVQRTGPMRQPPGRAPPQQGSSHEDGDDMSPTSTDFNTDGSSGYYSGDTGSMSDNEVRDRQGPVQPYPEPGAGYERAQNVRQDRGQGQGQGQDQYFDSEISPDSSAQNNKNSGSAWDRVRAQAAGARNQGGSSNNSSAGRYSAAQSNRQESADDYSFSSAEEERELAKSEAQKQFDARIERERSGKDF
ncbi:MAG: hypothetical protein M1820_003320 [Bogoriella megaspora]|nr:MAG: hypothetical protein M1820_003320 [Bogoriella megaspora]